MTEERPVVGNWAGSKFMGRPVVDLIGGAVTDVREMTIGGAVWRTGDLGIDGNGEIFKAKNVISPSGEMILGFGYVGSALVVYVPTLPVTKVRVVPVEGEIQSGT